MVRVLLFLALVIGVSSPASATTVLHGFSFDDNAFADEVRSDLTGFIIGGASTAEEALTGSDTSNYAFSPEDGTFITLGFLDNLVVNGPGSDIVVFELNVTDTEPIVLTVNGIRSAPTAQTDTGDLFPPNGRIEYTSWDLSDFDVPPGGTVDEVTINSICTDVFVPIYGCTEGADVASALLAVGALNSAPAVTPIPLPPGMPLLLGAVCGLVAGRRYVARRRA